MWRRKRELKNETRKGTKSGERTESPRARARVVFVGGVWCLQTCQDDPRDPLMRRRNGRGEVWRRMTELKNDTRKITKSCAKTEAPWTRIRVVFWWCLLPKDLSG